MKKILTIIPGLIAAGIIALTGCNPSGPSGGSTSTVSAEKNSFKEVTSKLDAGGDFYLYLSTEQVLSGLSQHVGTLREFLQSLPDAKGRDRDNIGKACDLIGNLIKESGIED